MPQCLYVAPRQASKSRHQAAKMALCEVQRYLAACHPGTKMSDFSAREAICSDWYSFPGRWGSPKIIKFHNFSHLAATQPECHETLLFAILSLRFVTPTTSQNRYFLMPDV